MLSKDGRPLLESWGTSLYNERPFRRPQSRQHHRSLKEGERLHGSKHRGCAVCRRGRVRWDSLRGLFDSVGPQATGGVREDEGHRHGRRAALRGRPARPEQPARRPSAHHPRHREPVGRHDRSPDGTQAAAAGRARPRPVLDLHRGHHRRAQPRRLRRHAAGRAVRQSA